jgi:trk system potassium uptake protein
MNRRLRQVLNPTQIVIASFALVIALGTILLSLPIATASGERMPLVDAFFTAVSATCVTGLIVVDTGTHFSVFGQLVILACIQIGGLGLMAFTTIFVVALGNRIAITDRLALQQSFHHSPTSNIRSLVKYILIFTLTAEALGASILFAHWSIQERFATVGETAYNAIFILSAHFAMPALA